MESNFSFPSEIKTEIKRNYYAQLQRSREILLKLHPLTPENAWIVSEKTKDYTIYYKVDKETGLNWSRGDTIIQKSPKEIADYINNVTRKAEWDNLMESGKTIETLSERIFISHQKYKPIFPTQARDFVLFVENVYSPEKVLINVTSIENPNMPPIKGYTRGHLHSGGFVLESIGENKTKATYFILVDPKGFIPRFLVNFANKNQAMNVVTIRKILDKI